MRRSIWSAAALAGSVYCFGAGCGNIPSTNCIDSRSAGSSMVLRSADGSFNGDDRDFSGDFSSGSSGGNVNVFSRQTSGAVERKIVVIVPSLSGQYDLQNVYLSYTETEGSAKKVWKASSGTLYIDDCGDAVILTIDAEMGVLSASNNNAAGSFRMLGYLRGAP